MLGNYVKIAIRNFRKHVGFTAINVIGLALGMACCIIIVTFILHETGFDNGIPDSDRLFRVTVESEVLATGVKSKGALSSLLWAPAMKRAYPEITDYTRFLKSWEPLPLVRENVRIVQDNIFYTESNTFRLMGWPLISGDPGSVFSNPSDVVLSESSVIKYFGDEDPIGKELILIREDRDENGRAVDVRIPLTVTGIMSDIPRKSHIRPEVLISFRMLNDLLGEGVVEGTHPSPDFWRWTSGYTYLQLQSPELVSSLEKKFPAFLDKHIGDANRRRGFDYHVTLQNVCNIHLEKNVHSTPEPGTQRDHLMMYGFVAVFVLLLACFNFVNLSTARATKRALEVGIRRVVGGSRGQLMAQFLGESIMLALFAAVVALLLSKFGLQLFSMYIGKEITLSQSETIWLTLRLLLFFGLVGLIAGLYPARVLSSVNPQQNLGQRRSPLRGSVIRTCLVILQFVLTISFIIGLITVQKQIRFMTTHQLGFDSSRMLVIYPNSKFPLYMELAVFQTEVEKLSGVTSTAISSVVPGRMYWRDLWAKVGQQSGETTVLKEIEVDYNFIPIYGLETIAGRSFQQNMGTDAMSRDIPQSITDLGMEEKRDGMVQSDTPARKSIVLNESAVQKLGYKDADDALGKILVRDPVSVDFHGEVIGVIPDFHFESLKSPIEPLVLYVIDPIAQWPRSISLKVQSQHSVDLVSRIETLYAEHFPEAVFETFFIDDQFGSLYEQERRVVDVLGYVSALSILIACLGLLGLIMFILEQRKREIGIRRVFGASSGRLMILFSQGYLKWIFISVLIAVPLATICLRAWLQRFAYRTEIGITPALFASLSVLAISFLTIATQVFRASRANPVDILRCE